jgi:cbb3-type cytochrome oxidase maturation protein
MFPSSLVVVLTGLSLGLLALAAFAWGWRRGQYRDLPAQSRAIFEPRDLRLERPWETATQRADRERQFGTLEPAPLGEWGDGRDRGDLRP